MTNEEMGALCQHDSYEKNRGIRTAKNLKKIFKTPQWLKNHIWITDVIAFRFQMLFRSL